MGKDLRRLEKEEEPTKRFDVFVSDLFDCSGLGGGQIPYLNHARQTLLKPGARLLPCGLTLHAMVVDCHVRRVGGLDLGAWNPFLVPSNEVYEGIQWDEGDPQMRALSDPCVVGQYDFNQEFVGAVKPYQMHITQGGILNAVVFWHTLDLGHGIELATAAKEMRAIQYVGTKSVEAGDEVTMHVGHNGIQAMFGIDGTSMVQETPSIAAMSRIKEDATKLATQVHEFLAANPAEAYKATEMAMMLSSQAGMFRMHPQIMLELALSLCLSSQCQIAAQ